MLNFTLSNYLNANSLNVKFLDLLSKFQHYLKYEKININQIECAFPFDSWNGGCNLNQNTNILLNYELDTLLFNFRIKSMRYNCSNLFLETNDFEDNYHKILLPKLDNGATAILISNLKLYEYLKQHYNFSKFILSSNAAELIQYTPEVINAIIEHEDFQLIQIPNKLRKDFTFLSQIKYPEKLEICINPICSPTCQNTSNCLISENNSIISFCENDIYNNCQKIQSYCKNRNILSIKDLLEKYVPLGINHFNFAICPSNQLHEYGILLIQYFFNVENNEELLKDPYIQGIMSLYNKDMRKFFTDYKDNFI